MTKIYQLFQTGFARFEKIVNFHKHNNLHMKTPTPLKRAILVMALISINLFGTTDKLFAQTANALNFDGNDDYVDITPSVPYTGTFTIEG